MDIKNFVLSYYKNSTDGFHIHKVEKSIEASKPHTHDYFQIYYVIKGNLVHYVDGKSSHLSRGNMSIIPPHVTHYIEMGADTVFYSFSFMPDFIGELSQNNRLAINFMKTLQENKTIRPKITVDADEILYIENIMEHILIEFTEKPLGYGETVRAYSILLLTMFSRHYFTSIENITEHFENNKQIILHCIQYIEENFTEDISLEEISSRCAMSKSCFCNLFHDITGHSFKNYLNLCRIKQSVVYIRNGYKISAIYGLCGFNDFSTFYRNFKKFMGISPAEYKEEQKERPSV